MQFMASPDSLERPVVCMQAFVLYLSLWIVRTCELRRGSSSGDRNSDGKRMDTSMSVMYEFGSTVKICVFTLCIVYLDGLRNMCCCC